MTTFPLHNRKLLADDVKIITWCPTADLVLLVSPENCVSLYRSGTGIKLVWSLDNKIKSDINTVIWEPNGKEFVLGCENGIVYKVDITYHSPRISEYSVTEEPSPITTFSWINYEFKKKQLHIEGFDPDAFNMETVLPRLSEQSPEAPLSRMMLPKRKTSILPPKPTQNTDTQTLLFIGNKRGEIHIFLDGIYPIGFISLNTNNSKISILNTSVAENAGSLQVLAKSEASEEYTLYFIDTRILELRKEEIFSISEIQTELNYLLQYTNCTIDVLKRHHDSYSRFTRDAVNEANSYIGEETTAMPEVELMGTLATGNLTAPMRDLFANYLTTQRIKQWEANANHGYKNSQVVLCEHILPACERLQLALSKLLGFSLWTRRYGDFLEVQAVRKCIECVQHLITGLYQFSKSLNSVTKRFSAFTAWLDIIAQRVSGPTSEEAEVHPTLCDEPEIVAEYLNSDFTKDSLAECFSSVEGGNPDRNLLDLFSKLMQTCNALFEKNSITISNKLKVVSTLNLQLNGVYYEKQPRNIIVSMKKPWDEDEVHVLEFRKSRGPIKTNKAESIIYAFLKQDQDSKLLLLKKSFDEQPLQYAQLNMDGKLTDFEFFDNKELGLLVQIDQETTLLQTVLINDVRFKRYSEGALVSDAWTPSRTLLLSEMIDVKMGCNGLPKRRLFGLVASNGKLEVHFMSDEEDEEDDTDEDY